MSETEKSLDVAEKEKSTAGGNYKTYLRQMQSNYDFVLKKMRQEQEEIKLAEEELEIVKAIPIQKIEHYER